MLTLVKFENPEGFYWAEITIDKDNFGCTIYSQGYDDHGGRESQTLEMKLFARTMDFIDINNEICEMVSNRVWGGEISEANAKILFETLLLMRKGLNAEM